LNREFDAVVVAEFERAFAAGQAQSVIAQLNAYGVQVWLPEARGPVDLAEPEHRALLMMLGHQSEREVLRNRSRTTAAMAAQVREQGRMLGGRRRTATSWSTRVRTRTWCTRCGAAGSGAWISIR
jgi:site-specific DNA recombinase